MAQGQGYALDPAAVWRSQPRGPDGRRYLPVPLHRGLSAPEYYPSTTQQLTAFPQLRRWPPEVKFLGSEINKVHQHQPPQQQHATPQTAAGMQRCPYLHEMKERLLSQSSNPDQASLPDSAAANNMDTRAASDVLEVRQDPAVGTVVKLNPDGYGSHTSPAHHCSSQLLDESADMESFAPKNAKTSLFIILSFIYAKLLIVICIAYVISEVVTQNIPLHYYEGFFTYLYGMSILFLLYVFCFLLQESACCAPEVQPPPPRPPVKKSDAKKAEKEKKKKKKKAAEAKEKGSAESGGGGGGDGGGGTPGGVGGNNKGAMFQREKYPRKMKDLAKQKLQGGLVQSPQQGVLRNLRTSKDVNLNDGADSPTQEKLTASCDPPEMVELESGRPARKRKTSQNIHSHGSFFLRVGAIAFGLGTMIYNGLECGAFFEIPFNSPCYQILRGINPVLQMVFTFMQMYFIFMNSRLNIHRFKVVARFGLMHVVATNLCVWIRTLVLESLKEISAYQHRRLESFLASDEDSGVGMYVEQEDLEQRLEAMLSRRAVAMAQARRQGRVDCVGASKGLFCGLLLLVASLICLILFFVMIHHQDYGLLAIYLADVSHCVLMSLSIIATIVGFIRVQSLKFRAEEQSDLNDILLRVSAFGLFVYAVFSVIAGSLAAFPQEPKLLIVCTGLLSIVQVVLQLLFIADVARRRVHLPEHDRSKPGRQVVTFLLICNVTMWVIYTFEAQKVIANPVQLDFYGFLAWAIVQRVTLPLCIFHRFHSAVTLAEIWKTSYKARLE